ncbi:SagB/ThcOx family dehydrogenase [Jiangella alkaliphila]|uniref:SagB-type dehydrogenase domain-containing protein n=1 Tax=Jiangella alkaliphila TaxID=419479 RepID=A0A1H2JHC0_9ACTN|nr:SagB/ThcOx family dehydrogenase [Jiangella alkaliphila]SDU55566.1 SagB-type dehydrogenase domain-containing protein [Jiangella alkaliphila]
MTQRNADVRAALDFHAATRYLRVGDELLMGTPPDAESAIWEEDRSLEPYPFKVYETLEPIAIPREFAPSSVPALRAVSASGHDGAAVPDLALLARIARLSNGLLDRTVTVRGTVLTYRTAGGTGARYHLELYFACADLPDLAAGLYQYAAHDHSLRRVRAGDVRAALAAATGAEPAVAAAPVIMAVTSTFWRNAWRYKARAYRHAFWDAGTSLSQALAVAASAGVPAELVLGFADDEVNAVLGVDGVREATLALCALGAGGPAAPDVAALPPADLPVRPVSPREVNFPAIGAMHRASTLTTGAEAAAWRSAAPPAGAPEPAGPLTALDPLPDDALPPEPVEDVILRRRSTRNYDTGAELGFRDFSTLLDRSSRAYAADVRPPLDCYLIVNAVEGLTPGVYLHHPARGGVELLRGGDFRADAARIAVGQEYCADAHVNAYWLADLGPLLDTYGNRGYRAAQLTSALQAGRLHLGTHALGLGAVGSTSADDEVVEFFSPHAAGKTYLFVTVFGVRRPRTASPRR